ncbi:MAG: metallophosphoesterase [Nanoarchaeota archaeon]
MMLDSIIVDKRKALLEFCMKQRVLLTKAAVEQLSDPILLDSLHERMLAGNLSADQLKVTLSPPQYPVSVVWEYDDKPGKRSLQDFVGYFNTRYNKISKLLRMRQELQNATSISRVLASKERQPASVIGMVVEKEVTKNDNLIITVEDPTGIIKIIITKTNPDVFAMAQDIVHDEVLGVTGTSSGTGAIFAKNIHIPDIPHMEVKKSPDEVYAVFLSCVHVGSKLFLKDAFERFIKWIRGEQGTPEQRAMAAKVGYLFLIGDTVDGIGIYPAQEAELELKDIYAQYAEAARLISQVPKHIPIIVSPGNHDALRLSEPQPKLFKDYAKPLWEMPNVLMTGNPCIVNIHAKNGFPGFNILTYHGYSFDDYSEIVPSIKNSGHNCSERTPLIMRFLLQRRHLAPAHTSTLYVPDPRGDPLVIDQIPDVFVAGHIHKAGCEVYRGVNIICCSTFQARTDFQERVGHMPDPGKVPIMNLQTRKVTMIEFGDPAVVP